MKQLNAAYEVLKEADLRKAYDDELKNQQDGKNVERLSEHLASSYGVEAGTARFLATTATVFCLLLDTDIDSAST